MADADHPAADPPGALPRGTRLAEFELRRVLGIGGFGIVYLAFDHALEREVAIKEYMPTSLVGRDGAMAVSLLSQAYAEPFSLGLRSFVNEARLLARFDHPSLVKVLRYWEANNTAYMAMPCYAGSNLHAVRRGMAQPPDEAWLRVLLEPLLGALDRLHGETVYHRDISPDNVILQPDGRPVLLDFGAARRVLGDKSMALTAILKPAYAPIEQYAEAGAVKQGPWTDLYSLGGTLHFLLLGRAPMPATARTVVDELPPLASQAAQLPGCSVGFLQCVDWMLQPRPADRPQHVAALRARLASLPPAPAAAASIGGDGWPRTQWLGGAADSHAPTVLDPSLVPATVRAPPAPDTRPTVLMPRAEPGLPGITEVMPRSGPPLSAADPVVVSPAEQAARHDETSATRASAAPPAALPAPLAAGRTEPTLDVGPTWAADLPPAPGLKHRAPSPTPKPTRRWPLAFGALGVVGFALWLVLRPAAAPAEIASATPGAPASAAAAAASAVAVSPTAEATTTPSPATASDTASDEAITAQTAIAAVTAAPPASTVTSAPAARRPARLVTGPAAVARPTPIPTPIPTTATTSTTPAPAPAMPPPLPAAALPSGAVPSLATSITRLPPAEAQAAAAPLAASAALPPRAPPPTAQGAEAARSTSAAPAAPPPAIAANKTPVVTQPRTVDRDAEPVLLQARALSPAERCEGRALAALSACIERHCKAEPGLRDHPDCARSRREVEQRTAPLR